MALWQFRVFGVSTMGEKTDRPRFLGDWWPSHAQVQKQIYNLERRGEEVPHSTVVRVMPLSEWERLFRNKEART